MEADSIAAITTILSYWGGKALDKVFDTATGEFTKDSLKWLKSIFVKSGQPTEVLKAYEEKPESPARQNGIRAAIEAALEDDPQAKRYLMELDEAIQAKSGGTAISNSHNVNTGTIHSGGNTIIGNSNQSS